jgi:uncharacterized protein DUF1843
MADRDTHFIPLYAAAMHEAHRSGDAAAMRAVAERAEREGGDDPEIAREYGTLTGEISRVESRPYEARVLYGVALQSARASGDLQQMQRVAERARTEGGGDPAVQSALAALNEEISRLSR